MQEVSSERRHEALHEKQRHKRENLRHIREYQHHNHPSEGILQSGRFFLDRAVFHTKIRDAFR